MLRTIVAGLIGLVFGTGIAISGMGNPAKVLNFFDIAGTWDPSLALVMAGALVVSAIGYRFVLRRPEPVLEARFHLPTGGLRHRLGHFRVLPRRRCASPGPRRTVSLDFRQRHAGGDRRSPHHPPRA
jgi:hypothetical protein